MHLHNHLSNHLALKRAQSWIAQLTNHKTVYVHISEAHLVAWALCLWGMIFPFVFSEAWMPGPHIIGLTLEPKFYLTAV